MSWELSSWARCEIIEKIEYRAECAGLVIERVYPQGTSRSCPRCGSTGQTCKSPDYQKEHWWGEHFRCDNARYGFEADRDYIGALNVARGFFSKTDELDHDFASSYTGMPKSCELAVPLVSEALLRDPRQRSTLTVARGSRLVLASLPPDPDR